MRMILLMFGSSLSTDASSDCWSALLSSTQSEKPRDAAAAMRDSKRSREGDGCRRSRLREGERKGGEEVDEQRGGQGRRKKKN
jgi:hypothetical protein